MSLVCEKYEKMIIAVSAARWSFEAHRYRCGAGRGLIKLGAPAGNACGWAAGVVGVGMALEFVRVGAGACASFS